MARSSAGSINMKDKEWRCESKNETKQNHKFEKGKSFTSKIGRRRRRGRLFTDMSTLSSN